MAFVCVQQAEQDLLLAFVCVQQVSGTSWRSVFCSETGLSHNINPKLDLGQSGFEVTGFRGLIR